MNEKVFHIGVKLLLRNRKGEILLLLAEKNSKNQGRKETYWDLPGGRVKKGEDLKAALAREVEEEIGLKNLHVDGLFDFLLTGLTFQAKDVPAEVELALAVYQGKLDGDEKIVISDEHVGYKWVSPAEAKKMLGSGHMGALAEKL